MSPAPHRAPTMNSSESPGRKGMTTTPVDEHDEDEQRVHPHAVGDDEGLEVLVDVQDEIDEEGDDVHGAGIIPGP